MSLFFASVFFGIIPMVLYALLIWRLDRWEKEPLPLLIAAFAWGAVPSIILALILQLMFGAAPPPEGMEPTLANQLYEASFLAPLTEELFKGMGVVLIFILFSRQIDSVLDGLVYGSVVGFGFAAVENVIYFMGEGDPFGLVVLFFFRAILFGMLHALFTGMFGVGMALGKFSRYGVMKVLWPLMGLGMGMVVHALHNYLVTMSGVHFLLDILGTGVGVVWFAVTFFLCLHHEKRWIHLYLADEVENGVLYAEQALDATNFWQRGPSAVFSIGLSRAWNRRHFLQYAAKLAYLKRRAAYHPTQEDLARVAMVRMQVQQLSQRDPLVLDGTIGGGKTMPPPLPPTRGPMPPPLILAGYQIPPPLPGNKPGPPPIPS